MINLLVVQHRFILGMNQLDRCKKDEKKKDLFQNNSFYTAILTIQAIYYYNPGPILPNLLVHQFTQGLIVMFLHVVNEAIGVIVDPQLGFGDMPQGGKGYILFKHEVNKTGLI